VINSGTANVIEGLPATDLGGRARQIGSAPDRGAFESTINDLPILTVTTTADSGIGSAAFGDRQRQRQQPAGCADPVQTSGPPTAVPTRSPPLTPLPNIKASIAFAGYSQAGAVVEYFALRLRRDDLRHSRRHADTNLSDGLYVPRQRTRLGPSAGSAASPSAASRTARSACTAAADTA
jgi:hypothetical protein